MKKLKGKPISENFSEENWAEEMVSIVNEAGDTHNIISCSKNIGQTEQNIQNLVNKKNTIESFKG